MKTLRKALELAYAGTTVNIDSLLEVIGGTSNTEIAGEILLGIYEEPAFEKYVTLDGNKNYAFTHYDKWAERVHYMYLKKKQINRYVKKDDMEYYKTCSLEEFTGLSNPWGNDMTTIYRESLEDEKVFTDCNASTWRSGKPWTPFNELPAPPAEVILMA